MLFGHEIIDLVKNQGDWKFKKTKTNRFFDFQILKKIPNHLH